MKKERPTPCSPLTVTLSLEEYQRMLDQVDSLEKQVIEKELLLLEEVKEKEFLRWRLAQLNRLCWGRSSEKRRLPEYPSQLCICFDQVPDQVDATKEIQHARKEVEKEEVYNRFRKSFKKKQVPHGRKAIAQELPRIKKVLEPEFNLEGAVRIGEEVTERYAIQPPTVLC